MFEKYFVPIVLSFSLMIFNCGQKKQTSPRVSSFLELKKHFAVPPVDYQTAPFWVWNDRVTKEKIDRQLADYKDKGIGIVFIHPRYGMVTEYFSEEWFELVRYSVDRAKELGMRIWLYDENSYPSGFAGGHVPAGMPESYNQGQGLLLHKTDSLDSDAFEKYDIILKKEDDRFIRISDLNDFSGAADLYLFERVFYGQSKWYGGWTYVDLLVEGVTEKFIEVTMNGYEKTIGDEFGKTVPGIFTDEPHISPPRGNNCMRWTPSLFEKFKERWGYDLIPHLPSLFEEIGDWKKVRHNYQALLMDMFIERWAQPWYLYSSDKNLKWTGHYWEHSWPNPRHGGDNMAMYAWHHLPGIDMLFNNIDERPDQFGNVRAVKELRSVANQSGRQRTLSETYGGAGWELTFLDMKRLGDWEYCLGVNFMNQHLSHMTLLGDRKHDYPQSFSYHAPYWHLYKYLADYYARLSWMLSSGDQMNRVLVLEPTTTTWMYFSYSKSHERFGAIKDQFEDFLRKLEARQIEYDLGSEEILARQNDIQGEQLIIGQRSYDLVVLPPGLDNLEKTTMALLEQYLSHNGKVLSFVDVPAFIQGEESAEPAVMANKYNKQWIKVSSLKDEKATALIKPADLIISDIDYKPQKLFHHRRQFDDGELLLLTNFNLNEHAAGKVRMNGSTVTRMDAFSGKMYGYPAEKTSGQVTFTFDLPPAGDLLVFVHKSNVPEVEKASVPHKKTVMAATGDIRIERGKPNTLTLDYCDLKLGETSEKGMYFYSASDKIFKHHGFDDNPWVSSAQYKTNILDRADFPQESGFEASFPFEIAENYRPSSLRAVVERPHLWQLLVNGIAIKPIEGEWWLDRDFGVFEIADHVRPGYNSLTLAMKPMSIFAELEPIYLLGDFDLESKENGWLIQPPADLQFGPWKDQGLPFYGHDVVYTATYKLSKDNEYILQLGSWDGSVAEVQVNGKRAGIIAWPPYELDITPTIDDGDLEINVIVYGTLKNLLGPHHNVTVHGFVSPWSFKYAPDVQPKGSDYDTFDYGLYEPFKVFVCE